MVAVVDPYSFEVAPMQLPSRIHVALAALILSALLLWPRALGRDEVDMVPLVLLAVIAVATVRIALRAGRPATSRAPGDRIAYGVDGALIVIAVLGKLMTTYRPEKFAGPRPEGATFGVLAHVYDPCERGEDMVVCSGIVRTAGYVCEDGYTVRVLECAARPCRSVPIGLNLTVDAACEVGR